MTTAIRFLKSKKIDFVPYEYEYLEKGGTKQTADELQVDEHSVVKTLVFESENSPFIVLMHGDREVSTKEMARHLGVKKVEPAKIEDAFKYTGYMFGGTSPFGTKRAMKVYIEEGIMALEKIYINGGKRGFIIEIKPDSLKLLDYEIVSVAIPK